MTKYQKFKLIIGIVFSSILLIILCNYSANGRYTLQGDKNIVLDTRTGTIYVPRNKTYIELNEYSKKN